MTDHETQAITKHYQDTLTNGWKLAFEAYASEYPSTRHIHSSRSRASLLHDHCVYEIQRLASDSRFITVPPKKRGLFTIALSEEPLRINGTVLARFKKLNERMLTSNISTKQVRDFNNQSSMGNWKQQNLFGFPLTEKEPPHVNIGYLPDEFWMSFEAVFATMPNGSHALHWYVKLSGGDSDSQTPIIDMPVQPIEPKVKRVTAKRTEIKKDKTGEQQ